MDVTSLDLSGTLTAANMVVSSDLSVNTTHLIVDTSTSNVARVGIGTSTPSSELDVNGQIKASSIDVSGTLTATSLHITGILTATLGELTVGNATINSGSVNGVDIGESSQSTARFTNVTATSVRVTSSLTATNLGVTISDATVNGTLIGATVDLNSGNIDGTIIGATTAADGTFTELTVDNDSGVARVNLDANSTFFRFRYRI